MQSITYWHLVLIIMIRQITLLTYLQDVCLINLSLEEVLENFV